MRLSDFRFEKSYRRLLKKRHSGNHMFHVDGSSSMLILGQTAFGSVGRLVPTNRPASGDRTRSSLARRMGNPWITPPMCAGSPLRTRRWTTPDHTLERSLAPPLPHPSAARKLAETIVPRFCSLRCPAHRRRDMSFPAAQEASASTPPTSTPPALRPRPDAAPPGRRSRNAR